MRITLLFLTTLVSANVFGCGTAASQFMRYWHLNDLNSKEEFLEKNGCSHGINYDPLIADEVIMRVLIDAINIKAKPYLIAKVIKNHNCIFAARKAPEYASIQNFINANGLSEYCSLDRVASSYIVSAQDGANLRSSPSANSSKVGSVREGGLVIVLSKSNEWALVESYAGKGYVYFPLLRAL